VFAEIEKERPDAIIVHSRGDITAFYQLIVELVEKSRLPAMYEWRNYVEAGGLDGLCERSRWFRHSFVASARKVRSVDRETRWR
jgi:hypothetical protein